VNASTIEIKLELELDGDTVTGCARFADGSCRDFSGWIGLMGLVDSLLEGAQGNGRPEIAKERMNKDADQD
jgi:hypothetical protein